MNKDTLKGRWHEVKGQLKTRWGRLTDDDMTRIEGRTEELAGLLQQRYGLAKEQAESECKAFFDSCEANGKSSDKKDSRASGHGA